MALAAGTKLGPYEILAPIGAGGMGEVYRARDTRLERDVAIKVSAERFSERFEREARAIASLNHTNVCHLYDVGPNYLVMEFVEGETLRGPLPFDEALPLIRQLIDGIEAAHDKNVVHRDLKPANIKITPEGVVKILDFGLARAAESAEPEGSSENSPTLTMGATVAGTILGTAAYMAPEQARGKRADRRSDIWSFGAVLYELFTGSPPFAGESVVEILGAVINQEPDWTPVPPRAQRLVKWCLDKDRKRRLQSIGDARRMLEGPEGRPEVLPHGVVATKSTPLPWIITAGVLAMTTVAALWAPWRVAPETAKVMRFEIPPPPGVDDVFFSLSPDGTELAYVNSGTNGVPRVWVRSMGTLQWRALAGTEGTTAPIFWSSDSRFIAFDAERKLKKVDVTGGPPQTICDLPGTNVVGGSWNREGVIVFGVNNGGGIQRVSSAGGAPSPVTVVNAARAESFHFYPVFLPDGRHFLFYILSTAPENRGIYLGSLDSKPDRQDPKRLVASGFGAGYVPLPTGDRGAILFERDDTLLAQPFDFHRLETSGEAVPVAEQLGSTLNFGYFAASNNGTLAFRGYASFGKMQLGWFDREGKSLGNVGAPHLYSALALSPDNTQVATVRYDQVNRDIWLTAFSRSSDTRFTFDPALDRFPVWSPDGSRIAFSSNRAGPYDLYQHSSNGAGQDELIFKSAHNKFVTDWSRDGRFLLYYDLDPKTKGDLWVLPIDNKSGERKPVPFLRTDFNEQNGKFSPDGHWVAYESDETGRTEIYVRGFPSPESGSAKWQISQGGGVQPQWHGDGKELFYLASNGVVMAVSVSASGAAFQPETPAILFKGPPNPSSWDVSADGKRFLFPVPAGETAQAPFTIVLNWTSLLKK